MAKKVFADVTKLRILTWRDYPGLSGWVLNATTCFFMREKQRVKTHRKGEGSGTAEPEMGAGQLQAKE